eukprot:gene19023-biopygen5799
MSRGGCSRQAGIEAADPAFLIFSQCRSRAARGIVMPGKQTELKGHLKVWEGWGAAVSDEMLSHGVGWLHPAFGRSRNVKWVTNLRVMVLAGLV